MFQNKIKILGTFRDAAQEGGDRTDKGKASRVDSEFESEDDKF